MEPGLLDLEPGTPCMGSQSPSMEPGPTTMESVTLYVEYLHQEWNLASLT